ncbi:MAG: hypothetical protein N2558_01045 [Patescibacteria group bacterium]|nr:hypothetical protein [Patescibacteria group bacterium]
MVEIKYQFAPDNLMDKQIISRKVVAVFKPYSTPVNVGSEEKPALAREYVCFYRPDTNKYYGAEFYWLLPEKAGSDILSEKVVVTLFIGPYDYSSEIPPNEVIPIAERD